VAGSEIAHTAHHRGQQMAMFEDAGPGFAQQLRPYGGHRRVMQNHAPTIYGFPSLKMLFDGEAAGGAKTPLPGAAGQSRDRAPAKK